LDEIENDPQVRHRGLIREEVDDTGQRWKALAPPLKFSATRAPFAGAPAPALGADTRAILASLGYGADAIAEMSAEGTIFCPPRA